jgi:hypothetical protein
MQVTHRHHGGREHELVANIEGISTPSMDRRPRTIFRTGSQ